MMLSGTGQAVDALNTVYSAFKETRQETGRFRRMATKMRLEAHQGSSKNVVKYDGVTAYRLSDGVDMQQAQQFTQSVTSYSPSEVGVQVLLAKSTLRRSPDPDLYRRAGRVMNAAYDKFEDTDGANILSTATVQRGAAGQVMSPGVILAAVAGLRVGNSTSDVQPAPEPFFGAFHPCSLAALGGRLMGLATGWDVTLAGAPGTAYTPGTNVGTVVKASEQTDLGKRVFSEGPKAIANVMGVPITDSANIPVDSSDDAVGGVFSKEFLVKVDELEPDMEPEDDKSARAIEMNLVGSYIYGGYEVGRYAVGIKNDASIPTS